MVETLLLLTVMCMLSFWVLKCSRCWHSTIHTQHGCNCLVAIALNCPLVCILPCDLKLDSYEHSCAHLCFFGRTDMYKHAICVALLLGVFATWSSAVYVFLYTTVNHSISGFACILWTAAHGHPPEVRHLLPDSYPGINDTLGRTDVASITPNMIFKIE